MTTWKRVYSNGALKGGGAEWFSGHISSWSVLNKSRLRVGRPYMAEQLFEE